MWASGEIRCATYNHYLPPNSPLYDCVNNDPTAGYTASGFRAARSFHTGGVNLLLGDGSVRFVNNIVTPDLAADRHPRRRGGRWQLLTHTQIVSSYRCSLLSMRRERRAVFWRGDGFRLESRPRRWSRLCRAALTASASSPNR